MTKPKTIAQKLVGLHQKICNVKGAGERLPLRMRFNIMTGASFPGRKASSTEKMSTMRGGVTQ